MIEPGKEDKRSSGGERERKKERMSESWVVVVEQAGRQFEAPSELVAES